MKPLSNKNYFVLTSEDEITMEYLRAQAVRASEQHCKFTLYR